MVQSKERPSRMSLGTPSVFLTVSTQLKQPTSPCWARGTPRQAAQACGADEHSSSTARALRCASSL